MKRAENDRKWKNNNPKKKAEINANWYRKNQERKTMSNANWNKKNQEKKAMINANWNENNSEKKAASNKKSKAESKADPEQQISRFGLECHGPIFTCICCMRDLFQRSVEELKGKLEQTILQKNEMHEYLNFDESLKVKDEIHYKVKRNDKFITKVRKFPTGHSLCKTCIGYLKNSQMPPMAAKNSLMPAMIPECLQNLIDLEKQLIVKNLIFIKVRQLPKTRMNAMNDRVINVPIGDDNIAKRVNSLPRTEEDSGMVNVGLKRKLNMKNYHKHGLICPHRVFKACEYLIKNHPAYKNIKLKDYEEWA